MISLCVWLYLLFSIVGLLSYASYKVINNIQLWAKVCRIRIHLPSQYYLFLTERWVDNAEEDYEGRSLCLCVVSFAMKEKLQRLQSN